MEAKNVWNQFLDLPPEAQKEAADFIAFLQTRYLKLQTGIKEKKRSLRDEAFVGMWEDREDMKDSAIWVRNLREKEWNPIK